MNMTFGNFLKQWRNVRRFSQLALSNESGISSRHISFLETGRSKPSRGLVLTMARVLDIPRPVVNEALLAAGFAPEYKALPLDDGQLAPIMNAITTILDNHAPMPAIVIDGGWNIIGGNAQAQHMMQFLPFNGSLNIVDALLNDDPQSSCFLNWSEIATWTLQRLQSEVTRYGGDSPLLAVYQRLMSTPRLSQVDQTYFSTSGPILTTKIRAGDTDLNLFTMLAEFNSAQDLTMSERRIELFFAADDETKVYFERLDVI